MKTAEKINQVRELIARLRRLDVVVKIEGGDLDIEAPEHVLTSALLQEIKACKQSLIDILSGYNGRQDEPAKIAVLPEQQSYLLSSPQRRIWILSQ